MGTRRIEQLETSLREARGGTTFAGTVMFDRTPLPVEFADISCVGACVRGRDLPGRGQEILLLAEAFEVVGTVVWSDGDACGIAFHRPIAPLAVVRSTTALPNLNTLTKAIAMRG